MSFWRKLERGNEWGSTFYCYPGERLNEYGTTNLKDSLVIEPRNLEVKWPDGTISIESLISREHRETVSDMGHEYEVRSTEWGIWIDHRGIKHWVGLEDVEVHPDFKKRTAEGK